MIEIREVRIEDIEKFNDLLNSICKERLYLGFLDGIPVSYTHLTLPTILLV